jgi:hypothetical protein
MVALSQFCCYIVCSITLKKYAEEERREERQKKNIWEDFMKAFLSLRHCNAFEALEYFDDHYRAADKQQQCHEESFSAHRIHNLQF